MSVLGMDLPSSSSVFVAEKFLDTRNSQSLSGVMEILEEQEVIPFSPTLADLVNVNLVCLSQDQPPLSSLNAKVTTVVAQVLLVSPGISRGMVNSPRVLRWNRDLYGKSSFMCMQKPRSTRSQQGPFLHIQRHLSLC
ncbi:hypothetical protein ACH5RR_000705 [Cinchona calisaya]|uniref:Uncharacterized protein n=1 Tax=Cinchona calisaya TaxID=153742 RepID=A0ABD3B1I6_9GENT